MTPVGAGHRPAAACAVDAHDLRAHVGQQHPGERARARCRRARRPSRHVAVPWAEDAACATARQSRRRPLVYQEPPPPPPPPPPEKPPPLKPLDPDASDGDDVSVPALRHAEAVDRAREHRVVERRVPDSTTTTCRAARRRGRRTPWPTSSSRRTPPRTAGTRRTGSSRSANRGPLLLRLVDEAPEALRVAQHRVALGGALRHPVRADQQHDARR